MPTEHQPIRSQFGVLPVATSGTGFLMWTRNKMNLSWKENSFYLQLHTIIIKTIVWHLGGVNSWHVIPSHSNHMVAMIRTATQTHLFQPQWTKISQCNKACNPCNWRASFKRTLSAFSCFLSCIHCCNLWCLKCKSNPSEQKVPASDCSVLQVHEHWVLPLCRLPEDA